MGQTLSEPVVEKGSSNGQNKRVAYGVSCMQGWRISMEDAHSCQLDYKAEDAKESDSTPKLSFFGVYDGHGGDKVAIYAGEHLHQIIAKQESFKEGKIEQALKDGFLATDRAILSDPKYEEEVSGCTASVGVISDEKIYVANSGDSRTVLGIKGRAKPLSFDHKPQNEGEKARIQAAGGFVDFGRVNGNLALSRALGDFEFKKSADLPPEQQIVTAFPDVIIHDITEDDEFLVIACDGIWDCQSSQAVVEFVRRGIVAKQSLSAICENMMDNCLASNCDTGGVGCDNMTMSVIALLKGKTLDEWYAEVASRVSNGDGPCAPPEYAEFRGPGIHHRFDDSPDDLDMDLERSGRGKGGPRIILLGDGSSLTTEQADSELFDQEEEDSDLENTLSRHSGSTESGNAGQRESTPDSTATNQTEEPSKAASESPKESKQQPKENAPPAQGTPSSSESQEGKSEPKILAATDSDPKTVEAAAAQQQKK